MAVSETTRIRDRAPTFDYGEAGTLLRVDETHFQVQCAICHRSSPVVGGEGEGESEDGLLLIANLGWTTTNQSTWTCPLCKDRDSGRYTVPIPR